MYYISSKYFMSLYVRPSASVTSLSKQAACLWCHKYSVSEILFARFFRSNRLTFTAVTLPHEDFP